MARPFVFAMCCAAILPGLLSAMRVKITRAPDEQLDSSTNEGTEGRGWDIGRFIPSVPDIYHSCKEETEFGLLDRWIDVTPDVPGASKLKKWVSPSAWQSWVEEALNVADEDKPPLPFDPFVLRNREQYQDNILTKTMTVTDKEVCHSTLKVACVEEKLQLVKQTACSDAAPPKQDESTSSTRGWLQFPELGAYDLAQTEMVLPSKESSTREVWHLTKLKNHLKQCSYTTAASYWHAAKKETVSVARNSLKVVPDGHCVYISTLDPSDGITLGKLDADLMGSGIQNLANDAPKLERLVQNIATELNGIKNGLVKTAEGVVEGGRDVVSVVGDLHEDLHGGGKSAGEKSVKWIKRLTLDSEVDTCLCCNQPAIDLEDHMAAHCMVAYTLGGQSQNHTLKHGVKTVAGTLYNLAQTAGNWLVPFLGANIVQTSHTAVCQYMCDSRQPLHYEQYEHGNIRKVPGLAMQTWFIPNPRSFFSTATAAGVTEAAVEQAGTGVVTNVVTEVVDVAT